MVVFSYPVIRRFSEKHTAARDALSNWYRAMNTMDFAAYQDLTDVFSGVEGVGNDRYVFNIRGNKYRIIALIHFNIRTVYIRFVGTHKEYDAVDARTV